MTALFSAEKITSTLPGDLSSNVVETKDSFILVKVDSIPGFIGFLKNTAGFEFDYLADLTAVDYWEYFELVYRLYSIKNNHSIVVKTRLPGRENLTAPSITNLFVGATLMEREIFDLFGIKFEGHSNLRRIFLWEGFQGYPLRRDYL